MNQESLSQTKEHTCNPHEMEQRRQCALKKLEKSSQGSCLLKEKCENGQPESLEMRTEETKWEKIGRYK